MNNTLTLEQLNRAMHLGHLGEQVAIRRRLVFEQLELTGAEPAVRERWRNDDERLQRIVHE